MLDARGSIFWPFFTGDQICRADVPRFRDDGRQAQETEAPDLLGAGIVARHVQLIEFAAQRKGGLYVCELAVVALSRTIDRELRKEVIGLVGQIAAETLVARETARTAAVNRTAKGQSAEPIAIGFATGIKAQAADHFRLICCIHNRITSAVERPNPVLHHAAGKVAVDSNARAAISRSSRGIQHRLETALHEIEVGSARA